MLLSCQAPPSDPPHHHHHQAVSSNLLVLGADAGLTAGAAVTGGPRDAGPGHVPTVGDQRHRLLKQHAELLPDQHNTGTDGHKHSCFIAYQTADGPPIKCTSIQCLFVIAFTERNCFLFLFSDSLTSLLVPMRH